MRQKKKKKNEAGLAEEIVMIFGCVLVGIIGVALVQDSRADMMGSGAVAAVCPEIVEVVTGETLASSDRMSDLKNRILGMGVPIELEEDIFAALEVAKTTPVTERGTVSYRELTAPGLSHCQA